MQQVDATALALGLTGDTIAANLMVVGMAAQSGLLPVSVAAMEQAITLNGVKVGENRLAFDLGRLMQGNPDIVRAGNPLVAATLLLSIQGGGLSHLSMCMDAFGVPGVVTLRVVSVVFRLWSLMASPSTCVS